ncbi:CCA tRNA nucleotidyltransferase [Streptococcus hongkongensis]|nr:tRNA CCA-pyrophosphorylase [Streptococcus uberis]
MKLMTMPSEFQKALPILKKIKDAGFQAYFVGGGVRDILLNRPIHDVDIATSSYPQETKEIFARTVDIGIEHGTVLVLENGGEYEITTFRTEDVYVDFRRPSQVSFVRSLEEDLKRRDFTVNALALDETGQVIDTFSGLQDLVNKELRAVGKAEERFEEDALRIMRGFRFSATLDFTIEQETFMSMCSHAHLLEKISVERSFIEFDKLLLADNWKKGLQYLITSKAYLYLPGLAQKEWKLQRFLTDIKNNYTFVNSPQAWSCLILMLDITKPKDFLKHWKTSNDFQKTVLKIVKLYKMRLSHSYTKENIYEFGKDLANLCENLREANGLTTDYQSIETIDKELVIHDKHDICVNGGTLMKELQMKPGPHLGRVLSQIESAIVKGDLANDKESIMRFVSEECGHE